MLNRLYAVLKILFYYTFAFSSLFATIIHVPADSSTIQAGLNGAIEGDTVLVAAGIYYENIIWPATVGLKLIGSGQMDCIIDGDSSGSVIRFEENSLITIESTTVLSGFTIQNGYINGDGGGIFCNKSNPNLSNMTVIQNHATSDGGGIYCNNSNPILSSVIIANNSTAYGGGIFCRDNSNLMLSNVTIMGNTAISKGGGIYCNNSNPILSSLTISGNTTAYGGGIYCRNNSNLMLSNVTITGNTANHSSGIYCHNNSSLIFSTENRCNIYLNNSANRDIGVEIYSDSFIEVIVDTFTVMQPTEYYASPIDNFSFDILNAVQVQVTADLYVSVTGSNTNDGLTPQTPLKTIKYATSIILADSLHSRTIHLANGIFSSSTNGEYFPLYIINNVSIHGESESGVILDAESGSVIRIHNIDYTTISNLTITGGSASSGGGIYCLFSSPIIKNVTITGNTAEYSGGGVYCMNSSPALSNVTITNNTAEEGAGFYCRINTNSILLNVTIADNNGGWDAGGILCVASDLLLINSILWNNSSPTISTYNSNVYMYYTNIQGGWGGTSNINADPLFINSDIGDYMLQEGSPCIDAGTAFFIWDNDTVIDQNQDDYLGYAPDMGAFESPYLFTDNEPKIPNNFFLHQNYPNPFNPNTTIQYELPQRSDVQVIIFDLLGRKVTTLVSETQDAGYRSVRWDATNDTGQSVSAGIYFYQVRVKDHNGIGANEYVQTRKMVLLK